MRSCASGGSPTRRSSRSSPRRRSSATATSSSTRSRRPPDGPALGFHRAGRWDEVLGIEECLLTTDLGNAIRDAVAAGRGRSSSRRTTRRRGSGYLRHLVVREGRNTGQVLVAARHRAGRAVRGGLPVEVLRRFPEVRSIHWAVNDTPAEVTNLPTVLLWGEDAIEEEILGLRFRVRPNAFLQTNTEMAETLYALAREFAGLTGSETVYDLYCGTGTIGLALAPQALTVWGVEISEESVACAIENAELNGIDERGVLRRQRRRRRSRSCASRPARPTSSSSIRRAPVSPGKALRRMGALGAPRIVYVSCNPTTLASDLKVLREDFGYELARCRPVDMFPHTPHVESVTLLELVEPDAARRAPSDAV